MGQLPGKLSALLQSPVLVRGGCIAPENRGFVRESRRRGLLGSWDLSHKEPWQFRRALGSCVAIYRGANGESGAGVYV